MSRAIPKWEPIEGDLATPLGFRAAAVCCRNQEDARRFGFGADLFRFAGNDSRRGFHHQSSGGGAGSAFTAKPCRKPRACRAIVANSGNANACTGKEGMHAAEETARVAAELLGIEPSQVLVASTGVIGVPLNLDLILQQLPHLKEKLSAENARAVAHAIMTTDTVPKTCVVRSEAKGKAVHIAGIAKGAGMIQSAHGHHAFVHHHGRLHGRAHVAQPAAERRRRIPSIASP